MHSQFLMQMTILTLLLRPWHRVRIVTFFSALWRRNKQKRRAFGQPRAELNGLKLMASAFENNRTTVAVDPQSTGLDPNYDWRAFVLPRVPRIDAP